MASGPINSSAGERVETDFLGLQSHGNQGLQPLN